MMMTYPIQIDELLERVSGNKEFVIRMLDLFFDTSDNRISVLRNEFENKNYLELADQAHKLKGIVGNLSINKAMGILKSIHTLAGDHKDQGIEDLLLELEATIAEAKAFYIHNPQLNL